MDADPEKKSWVSSRFITREDCGVQKRRCRYADCGKEYSRGTSHMILKRHWARAHADPFSLSPKSRASIGEVSDDQLPPGIKPPPYRKKASPSKTSNSSTPLKKKTATNSSQSKLAQTGGQFDYRAVAKKLKETPGIHLSFNIHTPKTKGGQTLGIITAHTLNETSGVVKSVLLEYKPLPYPNDTTAIYDLLRSCIMRFGCREKIISVASNSSECVTSAVQELDKRYKLSKNYNFSTVHIRCFPQFVHLNVKDVFQSQNLLIESIRKVIDFINKQNFTTRTLQPGDPDAPEGVEGATILTNDKSAQTPVLRLPLDANKSSWNSTYTMIDTFLNQRAIIDATLSYFQNTQDFAHIMIDWDKLYTLVQLIKPFYEIISGFVEDEHAPVSAVAALIPRLIDGLTNSTWGYDDLAQQANNIRLQLEDYRDKFLNDLTIMASLLDPRIKDTFAPVETRGDMIQLLRDRIRDHPPQPPPPPKEFTLSENSIYQTLYETEHPDQVTNYFARERAFRGVELGSFWECYKYVYPSFYNLGRSLVCVQASSVPADRMFAAAEHTERERMGHTDTTVPKEINRSWASYLEK